MLHHFSVHPHVVEQSREEMFIALQLTFVITPKNLNKLVVVTTQPVLHGYMVNGAGYAL